MTGAETSHAGAREWDAEAYDRVSDAQLSWGLEVLERLPLRGDETVLDAGCGSGRVTLALLERLPRGRVIAVDASESMAERARRALGDRAAVVVADLGELALGTRVDAIFSNAVFHWIADHDRLFARLHEALAPGGALVAQCGGRGNVAALGEAIRAVAGRQRFRPHLRSFSGDWNFAGPETTEERLERAGFVDRRCWLESKTMRPDDPRAFLRAVSLGPHLARLPERDRDPFVDAVVERMGGARELEYVRLNIEARRPPERPRGGRAARR